MLRHPLRAQVTMCAYWLLLPLASCVREHTLFEAGGAGQAGEVGGAGAAGLGPGGSGAGSGGGPGGMTAGAASSTAGGSGSAGSAGGAGSAGAAAPPWTESSCANALSTGKTGDPCIEVFKCESTIDCCQTRAYCDSKALDVQKTCDLCPTKCSADSDCGAKALCENYQCRSCPPGPCPETWSQILRNGCAFCVPPSECQKIGDPVCGELSCAPGLSCLPDCNANPSCCFGNRCMDPSCPNLKELDCLVVGCLPGSLCKVGGPATECKCQPSTGTFSCMNTSLNSCDAY